MRANTADTDQSFAIVEMTEGAQLWPQFLSVVELLNQERFVQVQAEHFQSNHLLAALWTSSQSDFCALWCNDWGRTKNARQLFSGGRPFAKRRLSRSASCHKSGTGRSGVLCSEKR